MRDQNRFISDFHTNFDSLKNTPVVLYGVGQFTKQIVEQADDFHIIGLMDAKTTGQSVYGQRVLSEQEVAVSARAIIIVANLSVAGEIYQRIERFTREHCIEVYFLNGLKPPDYHTFTGENPYWEKDAEKLKERILANDIISFDIFDTLLTRRCKMPQDVFWLVAYEMGMRDFETDFARERKEAEKTCYRDVTRYFQLQQIYDILCREGVVTRHKVEAFIQKELEIEKRLLVPRESMCQILRYAKAQGKIVVLTSDMYLGTDLLTDLLAKADLGEYDDLLISCEVKRDKYWGEMWEYLISRYPGRRILHIGDNEIADVKTAREHGMESYGIASANALLAMNGMDQFLGQVKTGGDGVLWGLFSAKAVNDPFCMNVTKGRLYITDMRQFGYLFAGPLVLKYLLWLIKIARAQHIDTLLFAARDGYLLERMYQKIIRKQRTEAPNGIYLLTSRRAASVAGIKSEEDIWFVFDKMCSTASVKYERVLERGFGIRIDGEDIYRGSTIYKVGKETLFQHTVQRYAARIYENAEWERANYLKYLESLHLRGQLGFVNFVCRGVTQYCMTKITQRRMKGFYFASEEDILGIYPYMEDIFCLYGENLSTHTSKLNLMAKYLYGETILSAPNGQLIRFSEEGLPIYEERRESFARIQECHRGIEQYMEDMLEIIPDLDENLFSNEQIDRIWGTFDLKNVILSQEVRDVFCFDDYYGE